MMKILYESISPDVNSSFRLLHNPRLNDLFYWHFHPEYELVYIEGASGTRHVGSHTNKYFGNDLVLIGSNIPHLNFDYGVKTDYEKVVLHVQPSFVNDVFMNIPELNQVHDLFTKSMYGIAFSGFTKDRVGARIKKVPGMDPFKQFLEILYILQMLAESDEYILLHDKPVKNKHSKKNRKRLSLIYSYVDDHFNRKIEVAAVAEFSNLSKSAFCRYFKKETGQTFIRFLNSYRVSQAKRLLLMDKNVSESCYECGFESLSYFNRIFKQVTGENPKDFKKRHLT